MSTTKTAGEWAQPPTPEDAGATTKLPLLLYDVARSSYWIEDSRGTWITVNETSLRRHMRGLGITNTPNAGHQGAQDRHLNRIQLDQNVAFAAPLAGYRTGVTEVCGNRILVTNAAKLITPKEGKWPLIEKLLENLFKGETYDQRPHVFGWLKVAYEALKVEQRRPGQALVIAGERDCGKSLFQKLITEILGGRAAKPYRYMSGETPFNSELCGAEHLMIEDEIASTDFRRRRSFGARIKDFTVNEIQSYHAKRIAAMSVKPFWRISVTLNDEPEDLLILPPIDESLVDKIILMKAYRKPMPMPTGTMAEREAFWNAIVAELPAFLWFLIQWEIPKELRSERFGIAHFHHPDLIKAIEAQTPENRLLELIDALYWAECNEDEKIHAKPPKEIHVTASELEQSLFDSRLGHDARQVLNWPNATGTYLGRLASKHPGRVQNARSMKARGWCIKPPPASPEKQTQFFASNDTHDTIFTS